VAGAMSQRAAATAIRLPTTFGFDSNATL